MQTRRGNQTMAKGRPRDQRRRALAGALILGSAVAFACSAGEDPGAAKQQALLLDPDFDGDRTEPASSFTLFEADPVRPVTVFASGDFVAVTNTPDDSLQFFRQRGHGRKAHFEPCGEVRVGMRPVAVAVTKEEHQRVELWVVNHLSDSVSVVRFRESGCRAEVERTIHVGDEPRDIVVARSAAGEARVFITTAHRGQHHPVLSARSGQDLVTPPALKQAKGLADVFVFDASDPSSGPSVVNLFTDTPRALAVGEGVVYAAGFRTGNRTSVVPAERVAQAGLEALAALLERDAQGQFIERDGQLLVAPAYVGVASMSGGLPAVSGRGRCTPDPRPEYQDALLQQICVQTDDQSRILSARVLSSGEVDEQCQCASGDGTLQPTTGLVVQFFDRPELCGGAWETFPDGVTGCWLDAHPLGAPNPAHRAGVRTPATAWNQHLKLSLPDQDVFAIDVESLAVSRAYSGVGTVLFGMAVQPESGQVYVLNTEAQNLTRFEGVGESSSSTVRGHLYESRISVLSPGGDVVPIHLNDHLDYSVCCERDAAAAAKSLAFPTAGVFSPDGQEFYFTALGSDKVAAIATEALSDTFDNTAAREQNLLRELYTGDDELAPSGPVGMAISPDGRRLFVKTHFTNELLVLSVQSGRVLQRLSLETAEPPSITDGRHILYNARLTSSHGDSACASCHIFGDMDSLSWDLGDPDSPTVTNPGPFALAPELAFLGDIAADPSSQTITADFRANKGPMTTQTLRGMANHGAQHWRGDRTRHFQDETGRQPNFGSLNEDNSFGEFDVAIVGLNGRDELLPPEVFQQFTNFALQLTLPPNPVRALAGTLTPEQAAGRALFFGCAEQSDAQYVQRTCVGTSGNVVEIESETAACACSSNPVVAVLDAGVQVAPLAQTIQQLLATPPIQQQFFSLAGSTAGLVPEVLPVHAALVAQLESAVTTLGSADLELDQLNLLPLDGAAALAQATGALLALVGFFQEQGVSTGTEMIDFLLSFLPDEARQPPSPFASSPAFVEALPNVVAVANISVRVQTDELARGTGSFRNLRLDCAVGVARTCDLRVSDSVHTCHGCHTLDPQGNASANVYRPGFFGTSGEYSFENESQILKVPHLRNLYQKAGMFGAALVPFLLPESVLGARVGGFFAPDYAYAGAQVRGTGFLHDGSVDTTHRFLGATVFVARPPTLPFDAGNRGFDFFLPSAESMSACVAEFRAAEPSEVPGLPMELLQGLAFCAEGSGIPDSCFFDPGASDCQEALATLGAALGIPHFAQLFAEQIRPLCFQLGSTVEGGTPGGDCYPSGLTERTQMEAFLMAFDTNLKPIVGQQVTLREEGDVEEELLAQMVAAAASQDCDVVATGRGKGYVMTSPRPREPLRSVMTPTEGGRRSLAQLLASKGPVTLTCYPPQAGRAEAWAAVD